MTLEVNFPVFDSDHHLYETLDSFLKYLPKEFEGSIRYVQVDVPALLLRDRVELLPPREQALDLGPRRGDDVAGLLAGFDLLPRPLEDSPRRLDRERARCGRKCLVGKQPVDRREVAQVHDLSLGAARSRAARRRGHPRPGPRPRAPARGRSARAGRPRRRW